MDCERYDAAYNTDKFEDMITMTVDLLEQQNQNYLAHKDLM